MSNKTESKQTTPKRQHKRRYISARVDAATREAERRLEIQEALQPYYNIARYNARCL